MAEISVILTATQKTPAEQGFGHLQMTTVVCSITVAENRIQVVEEVAIRVAEEAMLVVSKAVLTVVVTLDFSNDSKTCS